MKIFKATLTAMAMLLVSLSCNEDDLGFSLKKSIGFAGVSGTLLESNEDGLRVDLYANTEIKENVTVTIALNNFENLEYGVDFTTEPEPVDGKITLTWSPEEEGASFYVFPGFNGKERAIVFDLEDVQGSDLSLGQSTSRSFLVMIKSLGCPTGTTTTTVTHDFNTCTTDFATPAGFIEVFEPGSKTDRGWGCRAFGQGGSRAPRASAFGGTTGDDKAWMIMNPVRTTIGSEVTIRFYVYSSFAGPGTVSVKWSSDYSGSGNPLVANWTNLTTLNAQFPAAGSASWKMVEGTFSNICGENVYLAFQFTGATNAASASWDIDDLTFQVQ